MRLARLSVKEYLESRRMLKSDASQVCLETAVGHRTLAQSCLTYLLCYDASSGKTSTKQDLEMFPSLEYVAQSWYYHSTLQCDGEANCEVAFLQSNAARNNWRRVHDPESLYSEPFVTFANEAASAVYYADLFGVWVTVKNWCRC